MKHRQPSDATVIDFGAHFYPRVPDMIMPDGKGARDQDEVVGLDRMGDSDVAIAQMEEANIDAMAYTNNSYFGHGDVEETAEANDAALEHAQQYDEFYALAPLPTGASGEEAAAEFERSIDNGLNGGGLTENHFEFTDSEMEPVLEVADQTGAPIFCHVPSLPNMPYRMNAIFGREKAQQESITKVIQDGVFDRYPDLKIVWHHCGGNMAANMGRFHHQYDPGRWPNEELKPFSEFKATFEDRVYIDTAGFFGYPTPIRAALEELPSTNVLFGTDYPWEPRTGEELREMANTIKSVANGKAVRRVLGENALEIMVNV